VFHVAPGVVLVAAASGPAVTSDQGRHQAVLRRYVRHSAKQSARGPTLVPRLPDAQDDGRGTRRRR